MVYETNKNVPWVWLIMTMLLSGCQDKASYEKPPLPVTVIEVATISESIVRRYSASIEPHLTVNLAFRVGGYIDELSQVHGAVGSSRALQQGDRVEKGTALASLRTDDYVAHQKLAYARLVKAQAARTRAALDYDRTQALYARETISKAKFDAARASRDVAQAEVAAAQASLNEANTALADTVLKAPIDATVIRRSVEVGSLVVPGTPTFILSDMQSVKAVFGVPEHIIGQLAGGDELTLDVHGRKLTGRITALAPSADRTSRTFNVEITLDNADQTLKPGMIASVSFTPIEQDDAHVAIPLQALIRSPANPHAYAVAVAEARGDDYHAVIREVQPGDIVGDHVLILAGLEPGVLVIVNGATLVSEGQVVRITGD